MVHDYKLQSLDKFTVKIVISSNQDWNVLAYDGALLTQTFSFLTKLSAQRKLLDK